MDGWDVALLVAAGYLAVMLLVRLMIGERNRLLEEFGRQIAESRARKRAEKTKQVKAEKADKARATRKDAA